MKLRAPAGAAARNIKGGNRPVAPSSYYVREGAYWPLLARYAESGV